MNEKTNCLNCGAALNYTKNEYGKKAICKYCGTGYDIDLLGRIEQYKVTLLVRGKIRQFYVGKEIINKLYSSDTGRNLCGKLYLTKINEKIKLELIEY